MSNFSWLDFLIAFLVSVITSSIFYSIVALIRKHKRYKKNKFSINHDNLPDAVLFVNILNNLDHYISGIPQVSNFDEIQFHYNEALNWLKKLYDYAIQDLDKGVIEDE